MAEEASGDFADYESEFAKRDMAVQSRDSMWDEAVEAYDEAPTHGKGMNAANGILRPLHLKFCRVEPILHRIPDFDFKNMAFDEMHTAGVK